MKPTIIFENKDYLVIDKPPGMVAEPLNGHLSVLDWLIENKLINPNSWKEGERFGVVHRLDSDTSGVLIWAKNRESQQKLKELWQGRQVEKTYRGLVIGECNIEGDIELPIERDNKNDRMTIAWIKNERS